MAARFSGNKGRVGMGVAVAAVIALVIAVLARSPSSTEGSATEAVQPNVSSGVPGGAAGQVPGVQPSGPRIGAGEATRTSGHRLLSDRLDWKDLTPAEQVALEPLAQEWDKLEAPRRRKWIEIAKRFPQWTPEEQHRRQERMRELSHLTPEERRIARDTFARAQAMPPEKRIELAKQYQELPEERKAALIAEAKATKFVVAARPLAIHHPPVPNKAQIREGSQARVPGLPRPPAEKANANTASPLPGGTAAVGGAGAAQSGASPASPASNASPAATSSMPSSATSPATPVAPPASDSGAGFHSPAGAPP